MNMSRFRLFLPVLLAVACTKAPVEQFQQSIQANKEARSLVDWEGSDYNPATLFEKLRENLKERKTTGAEVCEGLLALSDQDLTMFEGEVNNPLNAELLQSCREELKATLEKYWQEQKKSLGQQGLDFTFPVKLEQRD